MNDSNQPTCDSTFQLKGSVLTLTVLQLLAADYAAFELQLEEVIQKNPLFFNHMPVVIDLQKITQANIDFTKIVSAIRQKGFIPVGITNANDQQLSAAKEVGLGILPNIKATTPKAPKPSKASKKIEPSKIVTQPVRSGQQVYAKNDLIILSSVSNGAEIIANGNIHVYGTLRGRAIAGAGGETTSRIFCHKLEAELVAIAGYYKLQEHLETSNHPGHTQVYLEDDQLIIASIN